MKEDFILVECTISPNKKIIYKDMFAFANTTHKKLKSPKNLSVAIIGIDNMSRLNSIRQWKKTRNIVAEELDWIELNGYTKVGTGTLPNLVAMTCGLSKMQLEEKCWANRSVPFDKCPFIWKDFKSQGYTTVLGDDEPDLNHWNNNGGFVAEPADIYLRPWARNAVTMIFHQKEGRMHFCSGTRKQTTLHFEFMKNFFTEYAPEIFFFILARQ